MEVTLLQSFSLAKARELYKDNSRLKGLIDAVLGEAEAYAADELVELAEEVLQQIAAVGIVHYLQKAPQKEVYNDFLLQLFNSSGHEYNAGPLFRWAANMLKDCPILQSKPLYSFFWQQSGGGLRLSKRVQHLAELRNQVMHGFFVLPPEKNTEEAEAIGQLLIDLNSAGFFDNEADYHFYRDGFFTGQWSISDETEWIRYFAHGTFGELANRIVTEQKPSFWINEQSILSTTGGIIPEANKSDVLNFITKNKRGAFAVWFHPADDHADEYCSGIFYELSAIPSTRVVAFGLYEQGLSYTSGFLANRLVQVLDPEGKTMSKNKKHEELIPAARKLTTDKVIVLINRIHLALFSPQHVLRLNNMFYENDILLVVTGHHHEYLDPFFNGFTKVKHPSVVPDKKQAFDALRNYLRFKGPSHEKTDEHCDVKMLEDILSRVLHELAQGKELVARRFADEHLYHIECVHEIFALLNPWVILSREVFEADTVDESYGFPNTITEATPIYLALGRRDLKLEYQHKVISL